MDVAAAREVAELVERVRRGARTPDAAVWEARLQARGGDLRPALDCLLAAGEVTAALVLVGGLSRYCQDTGRVDEGRDMARRALAAADGNVDARVAGRAWLVQGELAFRQGDQADATDATRQALAAATTAGDEDTLVGAEFNLARIAFRDGDAERIRRHADRMLALAGDDPRSRFGAVHMLGWAAYTAGDVAGAMERFVENIDNARAADHRVGEGSELLNLGSLALEVGEVETAADHLRRGLEVAVELDSSYLLPGALTDIGRVAVRRGHVRAGLELIVAGECAYDAAGLTPDPGDDAFVEVRQEAERTLGPEVAADATRAGTAMGRADAIAAARAVLTA